MTTEKRDKIKDPVCGMELERKDAEATHEYRDRRFFFCSEECRQKFAAEPGRFIRWGERAA